VTRPARDRRDGPFSDWLRRHPDLRANVFWLYAMDIDMIFHKYQTRVDRLGDRSVKLMMDVEVKTFGAMPNDMQRETLYFRHQILRSKKLRYSTFIRRNVAFWHFGIFVLVIHNGARPDECSAIDWVQFDAAGNFLPRRITLDELVDLMRFNIRPDTFRRLDLRRHHGLLSYNDPTGLFPVIRTVKTS